MKDEEGCLPFEKHEFKTQDGWRLCSKKYSPPPTVERKHRHPVMLVHGIASSHNVFDMRERQSLAWALCEAGYENWLVDLRGSGLSEHARCGKGASEWDLEILMGDLKAHIDYILNRAGVDTLHYIGHSLGGIQGLIILGACPDYSHKIRSLTCMTSAIYMDDSAWRHFEYLAYLTCMMDLVYLSVLFKFLSPFVGGPDLLGNIANVDRLTMQHVYRTTENFSTRVFRDVSSSFRSDGLSVDFGNGPQNLPKLLKEVRHPVLMLAGDVDLLCTQSGVQRTFDCVGSSQKRIVVCGPKPDFEEHYGHLDILVGKRVTTEVFPHVTAFLHELDGAARKGGPGKLKAKLVLPDATTNDLGHTGVPEWTRTAEVGPEAGRQRGQAEDVETRGEVAMREPSSQQAP